MGKLDATEKARFEADLEREPGLKEAFEINLLSNLAVYKSARDQEVKDLVDKLVLEEEPEAKKQRPLWMYMAAAVFVLLLLSYFVIRPSNKIEAKQLYTSFYQKYPAREAKSSPTEDLILLANRFYNQGSYIDAISLYTEYFNQSDTSQSEMAHLYKGLSHLEKEESAAALKEFTKISASNQTAAWYSAFAFLQSERYKEAKKALEVIAKDTDHHYANQAQKILDEWKE